MMTEAQRSALSVPWWCVQLTLAKSSHRTFRIERFLAKSQKQNGLFPNGFRWKLAIKSGTTPGGAIGEEPSGV